MPATESPGLLLAEEYWLLTTAGQELREPSQSGRLGTAMAALRDLERIGEVRWVGDGHAAALDPTSDCRCPGLLRAWHAALQGEVPPGERTPVRFALDPFLPVVWNDTAAHLVTSGRAIRTNRRWGPPAYRATDPGWATARRRALLDELGSPDDGPRDLPTRELDLLVVASASDSLSDLFRVSGFDPPASVEQSVRMAVQGSEAHERFEAAVAFRYLKPDPWTM